MNRHEGSDQDVTDQDRAFMRLAIQEMKKAGLIEKTGGPFGAVIVLDGSVIASAGNRVIQDNDPTAHAEINAIRSACRKLGTYDLTGTTLYSSGECCPMCYAAAYWARIGRIFYAADWKDCADIYDDERLAQDMNKPYHQRALTPRQILQGEAQTVWQAFRNIPDRARY